MMMVRRSPICILFSLVSLLWNSGATTDVAIVKNDVAKEETPLSTTGQQKDEGEPFFLRGSKETRNLVSSVIAQQYEEPTARSIKGGVQIMVAAADFKRSAFTHLDKRNNNLAYLRPGEILGMTVRVIHAGLYRIEARICNPRPFSRIPGEFWVYDPATGQVLIKMEDMPVTDHWDSWATLRLGMMDLAAGTTELHILIRQGGFNLRSVVLARVSDFMAQFFSRILPTETYVLPAGAYASVNSSTAVVEAPLGGIPNVGKLVDGDSLIYEFQNLTMGVYGIEVSLSNPDDTTGHIVLRETTADTTTVLAEFEPLPDTGGWYSWEAIRVTTRSFALDATHKGRLSLQLVAVKAGFNLRYVSVIRLGDVGSSDDGNDNDGGNSKDLCLRRIFGIRRRDC